MTNNKFTAPEIELIKFSIDLIQTSEEDPGLINTDIPDTGGKVKPEEQKPWIKVIDPFK